MGSDPATSTDIGFQFEAIYSDADLIELRISAVSAAFSGVADVYVGMGQLEEGASELKGFPRNLSDTRELAFGTFDPKNKCGGVSMRFYCADSSGHAYVETRIESHHMSAATRETAVMSIPIEASAVDSFVGELLCLGAKKSGIARLNGVPASVRT